MLKENVFYVLLFYFFTNSVFCNEVDSLRSKLNELNLHKKTCASDTSKLKILHRLSYKLNQANPPEAIYYLNEALSISSVCDYKEGIARTQYFFGIYYRKQLNYDSAEYHLNNSLTYWTNHSGNLFEHKTISELAIIYQGTGRIQQAISSIYKAIKLSEKQRDIKSISRNLETLAIIYKNQDDYNKAISIYYKLISIAKHNDGLELLSNTYLNLGNAYYQNNDYVMALGFYKLSIEIMNKINDAGGVLSCNISIANIYKGIGDSLRAQNKNNKLIYRCYNAAAHVYTNSIKQSLALGDSNLYVIALGNFGILQLAKKNLTDAEKAIKTTIKIAQNWQYIAAVSEFSKYLSDTYEAQGKLPEALTYYKLHISTRDSVKNDEYLKKLTQSEMNYHFQLKEEKSKVQQEAKTLIHQEEIKKQQIIIFSVFIGLIIVLFFSILLLNKYKVTKEQKRIIEEQKKRVDIAYETLHEKNKEIMDSIRYAARIQRSLITSEKYIASKLKKLMR